jgi:alkylhydroperoxidase/carboxymuconolactone decarboxylase family protein YurZ
MDEKTSVLICLGAATAANCVPCFERYLKKAKDMGLTSGEVLEAPDLAGKVKNGPRLAMHRGIRNFMGQEASPNRCTAGQAKSSCCGSRRT